jgi:hypothetical protein
VCVYVYKRERERNKKKSGGFPFIFNRVAGVVSGIIEDDKNDSKKVNFRRFIIKDHLLLIREVT